MQGDTGNSVWGLVSFRHPSEKAREAIVRVSLQCKRDTLRDR